MSEPTEGPSEMDEGASAAGPCTARTAAAQEYNDAPGSRIPDDDDNAYDYAILSFDDVNLDFVSNAELLASSVLVKDNGTLVEVELPNGKGQYTGQVDEAMGTHLVLEERFHSSEFVEKRTASMTHRQKRAAIPFLFSEFDLKHVITIEAEMTDKQCNA